MTETRTLTEHWQHWLPDGSLVPRTTSLSVTATSTDDEIEETIHAASTAREQALRDAVANQAAAWRASWTATVTAERDACGTGFSCAHHVHWVEGGGAAPAAANHRWLPLVVTAETTDIEIAALVAEAVDRRTASEYRDVEVQMLSRRTGRRQRLQQYRHELGGPPPTPMVAPRPSAAPPCPTPGRIRAWETTDAVWLQWVPVGEPLDLEHAVAQRVPVSATDTDADLAAAAERWLTGYGCPPEGTIEWLMPQLTAHRDRLADALG
ncbi:hypothetical protein [Tsukamurella spumae]|uniref:Uncharacterized protein n=1 Tax=Tsukamurella spumae TaxID=44753 RepID=A0A846WXF1_9ACTN|nr:hypothetical protein [Tsukamurella spumae]NKY16779.1 hypothetical protein [Tsukamurella spumae]